MVFPIRVVRYEIAPDIKPVIKAQRFVTQNQSEWRKSLHVGPGLHALPLCTPPLPVLFATYSP